MFNRKPADTLQDLLDPVVQQTENAIQSTQHLANSALDGLSNSVHDLRDQANKTTEQATAMMHRGVDAVRDTSLQLRDRAQRASDGTVSYIQHEPVKAVLIAAATGAALMALVSLMTGQRDRR